MLRVRCFPLSLPAVAALLLLNAAPDTAQAQEINSNCTGLLQKLIMPDGAENAQSNPSSSDGSCFLINQTAQNSSIFSFDYGVPRSPALMLAGLSADKITPANSLKPFVLSLPSLFGSDTGSSASAFDFAPAWLLDESGVVAYGRRDDWASYWKRVWYRTRLSGALSKGDSGGDDPTKAVPSRGAVGISLSLLDSSDPIMARSADDVITDEATHRTTAISHWVHCLTLNSAKVVNAPKDPDFDSINDAITEINKLSAHASRKEPLSFKTSSSGKTDEERLQNVQLAADKVLHRTTPWKQSSDWTGSVQQAQWNDPQQRASKLQSLEDSLEHARDAITAKPEWAQAREEAKGAIESCSKEASNLAQHGADLQIGAGVVFQGPPGSLTSLSDPNEAVWLAGRLPLDFWHPAGACEPSSSSVPRNELACWSIGGSGRYSAGEMEATGNADTPEFKANVLEGWAGIERVDSKSKFGAYLGYTDQKAASDADNAFSRSGTRWLFSGAYLLLSDAGMWVVGSYGNANGTVSTLDDKVAMLSLTFGPPNIGSGFVTPVPQPPAANTATDTGSSGVATP